MFLQRAAQLVHLAANAESVESLVDFEASLAVAEQALAEALKRIRNLRARAVATIGGE